MEVEGRLGSTDSQDQKDSGSTSVVLSQFVVMNAAHEEIQNDIALLNRVLDKLAMSQESDLGALLSRFLVPVLEKLDSPHEVTRNKV